MDKQIIKPSAQFKSRLNKTKSSIVFFIGIYILLLIFGLVLSITGMYAGWYVIVKFPGLLTFLAGLGIIAMGLIVFFFLIKFIFKSHKTSTEGLIEIHRKNHPGLFSMFDELTRKTGTPLPYKVYLSPDVNAGVFYESSFWSMFFPVQKNLYIGMGLINTLSQQELKAVLAHEFGHFSQKSTQTGSYVYNVNQIIYNMLYDNEKFEALTVNWARQLSYFGIFIVMAIYIITGIQWILRKLYALINKNYLALSREMEFHADEIAAHFTGAEALKNALLRMHLAEYALNNAIDYHVENNYKSRNIYPAQSFIMNFLAQNDQMKIINGFPQVQLQDLTKYNKSKLIIKDQWASHPELDERIAHLDKTGIKSQPDKYQPANELLSEPHKLQEKFTGLIFTEFEDAEEIDLETFIKQYSEDFNTKRFPAIYNGYYDDKNPSQFEIEKPVEVYEKLELKKLFSDEMVDKIYLSISLAHDIEILKKILSKELKIKTFDYEGIRYKAKSSRRLLYRLKAEWKHINEEIKQNDKHIFAFFKRQEEKAGKNQLVEKYKKFFDFDKQMKNQIELYNNLINSLQFVHIKLPIVEIKNNLVEVEYLERKLKKQLLEMLENPVCQNLLKEKNRKLFELYLSKEWKYFGNRVYFEKNLEMLFKVLKAFIDSLSAGYFHIKLDLLNYQAELVSD